MSYIKGIYRWDGSRWEIVIAGIRINDNHENVLYVIIYLIVQRTERMCNYDL